ncbi:hypothetical protein ACLI4Z_13080 [Natrialbaceae archaeon A-arb3/5]
MIGTTLGDIRHHIESLASEDGSYYLVCGRTGDRPVPATELYFEHRPAARAAAHATEQYREVLRRYDPRVPYYDVIVCQRTDTVPSTTESAASPLDATDSPESSSLARTESERSPSSPHRSLIDFCHSIAGVVFETIAEQSNDGIEAAIMETYLETAETIADPDELCLCLLDSIARELEARLDADEQARLLRTAAERLSEPTPVVAGTDPLEATLGTLQSVALLETYSLDRSTVDADDGAECWEVTLEEYALAADGAHIVTLPLAVELFRQRSPESLRIDRTDGDENRTLSAWQLTLTTDGPTRPCGLVTVTG